MYTRVRAKTPLTRGACCARGGTRTAFQPLQSLGSPETYQIRASPVDVRPSPKPKVWTLSTPHLSTHETAPTHDQRRLPYCSGSTSRQLPTCRHCASTQSIPTGPETPTVGFCARPWPPAVTSLLRFDVQTLRQAWPFHVAVLRLRQPQRRLMLK